MTDNLWAVAVVAAVLFLATLLLAWRLLQQRQQLALQQQQLHQLLLIEQEHKTLRQQLQHKDTEFSRVQSQYQQLQQLWQELKQQSALQQQNYQQLLQDHSALATSLREKQQSFAEQQALLQSNKQQLSLEFSQLAQRIFDEKQQSFQGQQQQLLGQLLTPFQQQLDAFKTKVEDIHLKESQQQTLLQHELGQLKQLNQQMTLEAHQLATALKGQKKAQGNWGELVLENVLERSGLRAGVDYQREVSRQNQEGDRQRPDVVVFLPQNKHLIIDAKVSLNAYTTYINSEDDAERAVALKQHIAAISARIQELAERNYSKLPGFNSPDLVFMFVPVESAFVDALRSDERIFQQALNQNILVATPTTLLTSLNIVRQLWRFEEQHKHSAELAKRADNLFNKLRTFLQSFVKIRENLQRAQDAYEAAEGQLVNGKANLVKQVNEFKLLTPAIQAELPEYFTEKAELELEIDPKLADRLE
ncbi:MULTISPECIES: DNA recombination protein RmuC [Rheinheimera]|uniref:DNA recombination protein RmuC n=1 Tax=Rheinheimera marina TaxID=1774958 RepID=A0ABV9JIC5_9GAMM